MSEQPPVVPALALRVMAVAIAMLVVSGSALAWVVGAATARLTTFFADGDDLVVATDHALAAAVDVLQGVRITLTEVRRLGDDLASGSESAAAIVGEVGTLTSDDLAASIESLQLSLPALVEAGAVLDDSLRTLSLFGVQYDPPVPFDEAVSDLQDGLIGLPESVREQGDRLQALAPTVDGFGSDASAVVRALDDLDTELVGAEQALGDVAETTSILVSATDTVSALTPIGTPLLAVLVGLTLIAGIVLSIGLWSTARRLDRRQMV